MFLSPVNSKIIISFDVIEYQKKHTFFIFELISWCASATWTLFFLLPVVGDASGAEEFTTAVILQWVSSWEHAYLTEEFIWRFFYEVQVVTSCKALGDISSLGHSLYLCGIMNES